MTMIIGFLPIIAAFLTGLVAIYSDKLKAKSTNGFNLVMILFLVVTMAWSGWTLYDTNNKVAAEKLAKTNDSLAMQRHFAAVLRGLKADTIKLNHMNRLLSDTRDTLADKLAKNSLALADKITNSGNKLLSGVKQLNNQITGGDAYCVPIFENLKNGKYDISFINHFNNAIPNVGISVVNYDALAATPQAERNGTMVKNTDFFAAYAVSQSPQLYSPGVVHDFNAPQQMFVTDNTIGKLFISMITPSNSFFGEVLYRLDKEKGGPVRFRIYKFQDGKIFQIKIVNSHIIQLDTINWNSAFIKIPAEQIAGVKHKATWK